jgi:hypothetical protein
MRRVRIFLPVEDVIAPAGQLVDGHVIEHWQNLRQIARLTSKPEIPIEPDGPFRRTAKMTQLTHFRRPTLEVAEKSLMLGSAAPGHDRS